MDMWRLLIWVSKRFDSNTSIGEDHGTTAFAYSPGRVHYANHHYIDALGCAVQFSVLDIA
jgi:hypothetical protein